MSYTETLLELSKALKARMDDAPAAVAVHPDLIGKLPKQHGFSTCRSHPILHGLPLFSTRDVPACGYRVLTGREVRELDELIR